MLPEERRRQLRRWVALRLMGREERRKLVAPAPLSIEARVGLYLVLPAAAMLAILNVTGPIEALLASMITMVLFWIGFGRANPRLVGLELIAVILASYYIVDPPQAVLWVVASALAGGVGAWLQRRDSGEDAYLLLVPATGLAGFLFLLWLGAGARLAPVLGWIGTLLGGFKLELGQEIDALAVTDPTQAGQLREMIELLGANFFPAIAALLIIIWVLGIWLAGRLARRAMGSAMPPPRPLMLFRMREACIFLLIIGLILEILYGLAPWGGLRWLAIPLLSVFGLACLIEAIAVVLWYGGVHRLAGRPLIAALWVAAGLIVVLQFPPLGVLFGLGDVWFDFRRLGRSRQKIDTSA